MSTLFGALVVALGGVLIGTSAWPIKVMRKYRLEQLWFVIMLIGFVFLPWAATLLLCPDAIEAYRNIDRSSVPQGKSFFLRLGHCQRVVRSMLCTDRLCTYGWSPHRTGRLGWSYCAADYQKARACLIGRRISDLPPGTPSCSGWSSCCAVSCWFHSPALGETML